MISRFRNKRVCLLVILAVVCLFSSVSAQKIEGISTGWGGVSTVRGTVLTPGGQRVAGHISVRISSMNKGDRLTATNDNGEFAFLDLPNGDYMIIIDKEPDFEPVRQNVNIFAMAGPGAPPVTPLIIRLKYKPGVAPKPAVVNTQFADVPPAALNYYKQATELAKAGDAKGAIDQLNLAVKEYPKFAAAYNDMGLQYLQLKDLAKADEAFKAALGIDRTSFAPMLNHAMTLFDLKLYAEAEVASLDVVKAKEDSAVGHYFLGQSLAYQGKFPEAQKELNTAVTLGGDAMADALKEAHRLLAIIYSTQGKKKEQAAELEIYLKLAPNAPDAEQLRKLVVALKG